MRMRKWVAGVMTAGVLAVPAATAGVAFAQDAAPAPAPAQSGAQGGGQNGGQGAAQTGTKKLTGVQGVIPGFAGMYTFTGEPTKGSTEKTLAEGKAGLLSWSVKSVFGDQSEVTAKLDTTGDGINDKSVHAYYKWMQGEARDRLDGLKRYQTKVETMRDGEDITNPFTGEKVTDRETAVKDAGDRVAAAQAGFHAFNDEYKEDQPIAPAKMKETYARYVSQKADQARKNLDAAAGSGTMADIALAQNKAGLEAMLSDKEMTIPTGKFEESFTKAKESGKAEFTVDGKDLPIPGTEGKGYIFFGADAVKAADKAEKAGVDEKADKAKPDAAKDDGKVDESAVKKADATTAAPVPAAGASATSPGQDGGDKAPAAGDSDGDSDAVAGDSDGAKG